MRKGVDQPVDVRDVSGELERRAEEARARASPLEADIA